MWKTQVRSLGQEDPLEKGMATHSSAFLPGKPHEQRRLTGYSSYGSKELDTAEWLNNNEMLLYVSTVPINAGVSTVNDSPVLAIPLGLLTYLIWFIPHSDSTNWFTCLWCMDKIYLYPTKWYITHKRPKIWTKNLMASKILYLPVWNQKKRKQILFHPFGELSPSIPARRVLLLVWSSKETRPSPASLSASQGVADSLGPSPSVFLILHDLTLWLYPVFLHNPTRKRSFLLTTYASKFVLIMLATLSQLNYHDAN